MEATQDNLKSKPSGNKPKSKRSIKSKRNNKTQTKDNGCLAQTKFNSDIDTLSSSIEPASAIISSISAGLVENNKSTNFNQPIQSNPKSKRRQKKKSQSKPNHTEAAIKLDHDKPIDKTLDLGVDDKKSRLPISKEQDLKNHYKKSSPESYVSTNSPQNPNSSTRRSKKMLPQSKFVSAEDGGTLKTAQSLISERKTSSYLTTFQAIDGLTCTNKPVSSSINLKSLNKEVSINKTSDKVVGKSLPSQSFSTKGIIPMKKFAPTYHDNIKSQKANEVSKPINLYSRTKEPNSSNHKLFNPNSDSPLASNKSPNVKIKQSLKYEQSLLDEIERLQYLIELESSLADTDIDGWKRFVLYCNQIMIVYKKAILNHFETFNKLQTNWIYDSWQNVSQKLLDQLDLIDATHNKLKFSLIHTTITNAEKFYKELIVQTNAPSDFEAVRYVLLGELGINRIKNGLLDTDMKKYKNPKQVLAITTRNHFLNAIYFNPNLGWAYHQLGTLSLQLDQNDIVLCIFLFGVSCMINPIEFNSRETLLDLYQSFEWNHSPLYKLLQLYCKLAFREDLDNLRDDIVEWKRMNRNMNITGSEIFNLMVVGLISYYDFGRKMEGLNDTDITQLPSVQIILTFADINITFLQNYQVNPRSIIMVYSLMSFYHWIDCNKLYPVQFSYSNPNPISTLEGWSTVVTGLNVVYSKLYPGWVPSNNSSTTPSSNGPLDWFESIKNKMIYLLSQSFTHQPGFNGVDKLKNDLEHCMKYILNIGFSWTKLPKSIITFNSDKGFTTRLHCTSHRSRQTAAERMAALDINSIQKIDLPFRETNTKFISDTDFSGNEKIQYLKKQIHTLNGYVDPTCTWKKGFNEINPENIYLVFDTNFIINQYSFLEQLINRHTFKIVFPAIAISELKGLTHSSETSSKCVQVVSLLNYLYTPPGPPNNVKILTIKGNTIYHPDFSIEQLPEDQRYHSLDDGILQLCHNLSEKHPNQFIALITDDKNMRIRARGLGIEIFSKNKISKLLKHSSSYSLH